MFQIYLVVPTYKFDFPVPLVCCTRTTSSRNSELKLIPCISIVIDSANCLAPDSSVVDRYNCGAYSFFNISPKVEVPWHKIG